MIDNKQLTDILLIEDDDGDAELFKIAMNNNLIKNHIVHVSDGEQAIDYLKNNMPALIFLDLNLPKIHGSEVLKFIKEDECLRMIPVIIMTTSNADKDILSCYYHHCNCYMTKPVSFEEFTQRIKDMKNTWLSVVTLPFKVME